MQHTMKPQTRNKSSGLNLKKEDRLEIRAHLKKEAISKRSPLDFSRRINDDSVGP